MPSRAIIYVTDTGFLYPTLVSADQMWPQAEENNCDILIYLINVDEALIARVAAEFPRFHVIGLSDQQFALPDGVFFKKDHVALATLGRLVLFEHIPVQYEHVVYVDGDTLILGDVSDLLLKDVPLGNIAAGRGGLWLSKYEYGPGAKADRAYVRSIGTTVEEYFNAGVLAFRRQTLATLGPDALHYFFENSKACRQHDQSALNAVARGKVEFIWPGYNYHGSYDALGATLTRSPAIVHLTGPFKPWLMAEGPNAKYSAAYEAFDRRFPVIAELRKRQTAERSAELLKQWRKNKRRSSLFFWRPVVKRYLLEQYDRTFESQFLRIMPK
ncbi:MAG: glycosyltransferase [Agrobacterium sp.]|nr:glycosyltransferase [Agrobacterium sp.]